MAIIPFPQQSNPDLLGKFLESIINYGLEINHLQEEAKIHRCFSSASGKRKQSAGWYVYYICPGGLIARYGDWVLGDSIEYDDFTGERVDFDNFKRLLIEQERLNKIEIENIAAKEAQEIVASSSLLTNHPYLLKKGLPDTSCLVNGGLVIVPVIDNSNKITSFQYIFNDGNKKYLKGGRTKGCFSLVGLQYHELNSITEIYISEGYSTSLTINKYSKKPVIMAHNCHKLKDVCAILLGYKNITKITICADNDHKTEGNPGLTCAYESQKLDNKIIVIYPKNIQGTDFNDLLVEKGENELLDQLGLQKKLTLFKKLSDFQVKHAEYIIGGILQKNTVNCIFGAPSHGKTHVILSMAIAVSVGKDWYGHEVKSKGGVLYICGEDITGALKRSYAIAKEFGAKSTEELDLYITESAVHFMDASSVNSVKEQISLLLEPPSLIVIDTLNRNLGDGDENNTKDMTKFFDAVDSLRVQTGATIVLVHHSSKANPEMARGSSVIFGGVHTEILINKSKENASEFVGNHKEVINMSCTKQKDDADFLPLTFALDTNYYGPYLRLLTNNLTPNLIVSNSPKRQPKYKDILELIRIHVNLKSNFISHPELNKMFSEHQIDGSYEKAYLNELMKEGVLVITPIIDKFEINLLTLNNHIGIIASQQ